MFHELRKKRELYSPICMEISPIAQVALLHTDMNSGLRFAPRMGMKSAAKGSKTNSGFRFAPRMGM